MSTLAMLHTGPVVIQPLKGLAQSVLPGLRLVNLMDDSIIPEIEENGYMPDTVRDRLNYLGRCAADADADAILITCSSISELAEPVAQYSGLPVYKIDEAMAEEAVQRGRRIGVVATLPTTLEPTCALIEEKAQAIGTSVTVDRGLCREAFDRLSEGDEQGHDRIVMDTVEGLAEDHDVIVLAQASMARLRDKLTNVGVPVLTSPELGMNRTRGQLQALGLLDAAPSS